jgi:hypothetical protein
MLEAERLEAENAARKHLAQYVANRRKLVETFASIDPDAEFTNNAKGFLSKALQDQADFETNLVVAELARIPRQAK